jgi:Anti-sigma factor NepR
MIPVRATDRVQTFRLKRHLKTGEVGARPRMNCRGLFDSVRAGIGIALRSLHSDMLHEPLSDRIAELLRQLDEQLRQLDQDTDKA